MTVAFPKLPLAMSRAEYLQWAAAQPRGRFERVRGRVVAMAPERTAHNRVKMRVWQALDRALRAGGLQCEALGDGITVEIGDDTDYEPDALVNCGEPMAANAIAAPNPVIVVEVLSPSSVSSDTGAKLADYFHVPSIMHYLILHADAAQVIHHRREADGTILTRVITEAGVMLDPPGIRIELNEIYLPPA